MALRRRIILGFFESLRIELDLLSKEGQSEVDLVIVCPPTVKTELRQHSLTVPGQSLEQHHNEKAISVEECAAVIVDAADRRLRKVYFPFSSMAAAYLRPFVPDFVDGHLKRRAKL